MSAFIFQTQSFLILCLLLIGVFMHKIQIRHWQLMLAAVVWDILLIIQIEFNRQAIIKATQALTQISQKIMLNIHVSIAITTVMLYFIQLYLGQKSYNLSHQKTSSNSTLKSHRILGYLTLSMRGLTFITSFFI